MAAAPPPYDGGGRGGRGDFGGRGGRGFGRGGGGPPVDATASIQVPQLYYSIDVECVATAPDHNARAVAQIALVDQYERVILNLYVLPEAPVVSYLTALTGLTAEVVQTHGRPLAEQLAVLRAHLPPASTLVGQNILMDVGWLGLREGVDYAACIDLAGLYRVWNPKYNGWTAFSQDHCAQILLGWDVDATAHDAALDAVKSVRLFNYWAAARTDPGRWAAAQAALLAAPPRESFAKRNPTYDGVCMGNRRTCTCGAPFFT